MKEIAALAVVALVAACGKKPDGEAPVRAAAADPGWAEIDELARSPFPDGPRDPLPEALAIAGRHENWPIDRGSAVGEVAAPEGAEAAAMLAAWAAAGGSLGPVDPLHFDDVVSLSRLGKVAAVLAVSAADLEGPAYLVRRMFRERGTVLYASAGMAVAQVVHARAGQLGVPAPAMFGDADVVAVLATEAQFARRATTRSKAGAQLPAAERARLLGAWLAVFGALDATADRAAVQAALRDAATRSPTFTRTGSMIDQLYRGSDELKGGRTP